MKNFMGQSKRKKMAMKSTVTVENPVMEAPVTEAPQVHKMDVSQNSLAMLEQGMVALRQQHERLLQQVKQCEFMIAKQEGGIEVMRQLLAGQNGP